MTRKRSPRVALISVGMGRVRRGFERYFGDLFDLLRNDVDLTSYRSAGGDGDRARVPVLLRSVTSIARALPLGTLAGSAEYNRDCLAFGLCLLPDIAQRGFDVLHCIDPPLAVFFAHLRRVGLLRPAVLFTEGCVMPPELYPRVDHIHHVGMAAWSHALDSGFPRSRMSLVPCGFRAADFRNPGTKEELRRKYGIPEDTFVVLSVSAIKQIHKRVGYIAEEFGRLRGNALLWLDGNAEDAELITQTQRGLGARCRITHLESSRVSELYRLADVFVHASLSESFGLAIVEALAAGTPVLAHSAPHFEWLIGDPNCLLDMNLPGALADRLLQLRESRADAFPGAAARSEHVYRCFDWSNLKEEYIAMYRKVAGPQFDPESACL